MTAATHSFMAGDILKTPGFFTAAIAADGEDPFERSFSMDNISPENMNDVAFLRQYDANMTFHPGCMADGTYTPLFAYSTHPNSYLSPAEQIQAPSPPQSATVAPAGWPASERELQQLQLQQQPLQAQMSTLHPIATQNHPGYSRVQYGQVTPPDDEGPVDFGYSLKEEDESAAVEQVETHSARPRRQASSNTGATTAGSKRNRKRSKTAQQESKLRKPEDEKRSKFLERNRMAASKCRQKKKEWTSNLEDRARELQTSKNQLSVVVNSLKEEVLFLKGEMLKHTGCNCTQIRDYLSHEAKHLSETHQATFRPLPTIIHAASPLSSTARGSRLGGSSSAASSAIASPRSTASAPHSPHFHSEHQLEALLASNLCHDTSHSAIAAAAAR